MHIKFCPDHLKEENLEVLRIDWRVILNGSKIGWEGVNYIHLAQNRDQLMGRCEHFNAPSRSIKGG
jgi:hypothetical protein